MNQLVFIQNSQVVTDSLSVAEVFEKRHDHVLRDIEHLGCSEQFRLSNFGETHYVHPQNKQSYKKYIITQDGFTLLAMGYTGEKAMKFKEMYINEFNRMKQHLIKPQSIEDLIIMQAQSVKELKAQVSSLGETVSTIQETFLQRDEDWRKSINTMLNRAAFKLGGQYRDLRNKSYAMLEERGRCDLNKRLRNLLDRLEHNGATKTQIDKASKMDVIENDVRLKEIYTTIVKELSIGSIKVV